MLRAGARDQHTAGSQEMQRAQVDLLVAAQRTLQRAPTLGEGRRIENDQIELPALIGPLPQQVETVSRDRLVTVGCAVERQVLVGQCTGVLRAIYVDHYARTRKRRVHAEAAAIGEAVEHS